LVVVGRLHDITSPTKDSSSSDTTRIPSPRFISICDLNHLQLPSISISICIVFNCLLRAPSSVANCLPSPSATSTILFKHRFPMAQRSFFFLWYGINLGKGALRCCWAWVSPSRSSSEVTPTSHHSPNHYDIPRVAAAYVYVLQAISISDLLAEQRLMRKKKWQLILRVT
jgi:hypothetical protein